MPKYPCGANRKNAKTIGSIGKKETKIQKKTEKDQICWCGVRAFKDREL